MESKFGGSHRCTSHRPGLPPALTIRRFLHQPPVLTEVICGFAQEASNCVILRGQGRKIQLCPCPKPHAEGGGARLRLGCGAALRSCLRELSPRPAAPHTLVR